MRARTGLLRAKDQAGQCGHHDLSGVRRKESEAWLTHLSIRPPVPYLTTLTSGYFKDDEKQMCRFRGSFIREYRKSESALLSPFASRIDARARDSILSIMRIRLHGAACEQGVTRAWSRDETMQQGLSARGCGGRKWQEIVAVAATRQNDDGAFGLWMTLKPDLHFDHAFRVGHAFPERGEGTGLRCSG